MAYRSAPRACRSMMSSRNWRPRRRMRRPSSQRRQVAAWLSSVLPAKLQQCWCSCVCVHRRCSEVARCFSTGAGGGALCGGARPDHPQPVQAPAQQGDQGISFPCSAALSTGTAASPEAVRKRCQNHQPRQPKPHEGESLRSSWRIELHLTLYIIRVSSTNASSCRY